MKAESGLEIFCTGGLRSEFAQNFDVTSWVKKPVPTGSRGLKTEL
jgi:hypothetical protein